MPNTICCRSVNGTDEIYKAFYCFRTFHNALSVGMCTERSKTVILGRQQLHTVPARSTTQVEEESSARRLALAQNREKCYCQTSGNSTNSGKVLLLDVWQSQNLEEIAIARRLAMAKSREKCYCQSLLDL